MPQYLRLWDVASREMLTEVPLRDGQPQNGNFGVLIQDGVAYASDPNDGTIQTFDIESGLGSRQLIVSNHDNPDGLAWSPVRLDVMTRE